jgi:Putative lumazine-binding
MHRMTIAAVVLLALTAPALRAQQAHAGHGGSGGADVAAIEAVITEAYINGIHKNGDRAVIRRGFHPSFVMKVLSNGQVSDVTIEQWIARLPAEGTPVQRQIAHRFPNVTVTGSAAVATVEVDVNGRHTYTDLISLYKFAEGWRMVGKIFYTHPN